MKELLEKLGACDEAKIWAADKSWQEIYETCHRGDWLLWLFAKTNPNNLKRLTLAKGHCAATVLHLMTNEDSKKAVEAAIDFGHGIINRQELTIAALYAKIVVDAAADAAYAAYADVDAAAYAAYAAYVAADATSYASNTATYATNAAGDVAYAAGGMAYAIVARVENRKLTADIVRKYIPIELWNI